MGIAYRTVPPRRLIVEVWDGVITPDAWRDHVREILEGPGRAPTWRSLTDVRTADVSLLTEEDKAGIVAMYVPFSSEFVGMRAAAVASDEFESSAAFGRQLQHSGPSVVVFNDVPGACSWLGVEVAEVHAILRDLREQLRQDRERGSS